MSPEKIMIYGKYLEKKIMIYSRHLRKKLWFNENISGTKNYDLWYLQIKMKTWFMIKYIEWVWYKSRSLQILKIGGVEEVFQLCLVFTIPKVVSESMDFGVEVILAGLLRAKYRKNTHHAPISRCFKIWYLVICKEHMLRATAKYFWKS